MPKFEQLQTRHRRSREESVPSTFPENHLHAHGNPGDGSEELLGEITVLLSEHEHLHEEAHRHLGHLGLGVERPS